jgi:hypothetical protein
MNATAFYDHVTAVMIQPPHERHQQLAQLHADALRTYHAVLDQLTAEDVRHPRLEQTMPFWKRLHNGTIIHNITMGWNLWLTMLEHLAVEHASLLERSKDV